MHGPRKLHAREWDADWLCYDLTADPEERTPLPPTACTDLREAATTLFTRRPGEAASE